MTMPEDKSESPLQGAFVIGSGIGGLGCLAPILVVIAIFAGRWLDNLLGTAPWILLGLLVASIVLSLAMMIWMATSAARDAQRRYLAGKRDAQSIYPHNSHEEDNR